MKVPISTGIKVLASSVPVLEDGYSITTLHFNAASYIINKVPNKVVTISCTFLTKSLEINVIHTSNWGHPFC